MQLLLSTVYQQAKKTDRNVELAIDEAHYLFEDQANLDFLETAFRHQRHAGLRMVLLSPDGPREFYETDQAEKILGMCPIKVFHKLPDLDDEDGRQDRTDARAATVRPWCRRWEGGPRLQSGTRPCRRTRTYPLHIVADPFEKRVIDYEPADQEFIQQAISEQSEELVDFDAFVENEAQMNALTSHYDLCEQEATRLLDGELSEAEIVDAVVANAQRNGTAESSALADSGEDARQSDDEVSDDA